MEIIEFIFLGLAWVTVVSFLISGLDDLFFDTHYLLYLFRHRRTPIVQLSQLKLAPEQWIALFVPAWQEGGIVNRMAEYAANTVLYEKYDIFIGVYPNDPDTIDCVDKICAQHPRIHKVVVPHPGPTSKADCLNWLYRAMKLNEIPGQREYRVMAIHDAEDILHPLTLKVYNYFVPRTYDMAQLPVFALEQPAWKYWTANTYIDDFSELHTKDLFIRESIGGVVPSAGVGTCFHHKVLDQLAGKNQGDPFLLGNLTEDYEIGIRIKRAGYRTGIIHYPVERIVRRPRSDGTLGPPKSVLESVAVREVFPSRFWAAVRQRTRWILGISFQTWEQAGWAGSLPVRYTLLRDRRAPLTHLINMAGYLTLAGVLAQWWFSQSAWAQQFYWRPVFRPDSVLWSLVIICTWLLIYRAAQKFISVWYIYNLKQALFSIPRTVVNNLINFLATMRAVLYFAAHKLLGKHIVWHKTTHVFPNARQLAEYRKSIEDLLVEEGVVTHEQLLQAMRHDSQSSAPLCLLRLGLLPEYHYTELWSRHSGLKQRPVNLESIPESLLRQIDERQSQTQAMVPVDQAGQVAFLAFQEPPLERTLAGLNRQLNLSVQPVLARPSEITFARDHAYPKLVLPPPPGPGWISSLRRQSNLQPEIFFQIVKDHQSSGIALEEILVHRGIWTNTQARQALANHWQIPPYTPAEGADHGQLDYELYYSVGPAYWWLHRLLPISPNLILTCGPVHPQVQQWLQTKIGRPAQWKMVLPGQLDSLASQLKAAFDPDEALLDSLKGKELLTQGQLQNIQAARKLIQDPLPNWLRLQNLVPEDRLHETFLEICGLPPADPSHQPASPVSLQSALPPEYPETHRCYVLHAQDGVTIGLAQIPHDTARQRIFRRLTDYPVAFRALSWTEAQAWKSRVHPMNTRNSQSAT